MAKPSNIKTVDSTLWVIFKAIKDQATTTILITNINTKDNFIMINRMAKDKSTGKRIMPSLLD